MGATTPVHVTLRARVVPLRAPEIVATLCQALRGANRRDPERFRIVHVAIRDDRLELVVEAKNERYLSEGMRGLAIRTARAVNLALARTGPFWTDRWRGRVLKTPADVHATLLSMLPPPAEPPLAESPGTEGAPMAPPRTALLRSAWHGPDLLDLREPPVRAPSQQTPPRRYGVPRGASLAGKTSPVLEDQIDVSH